MRSEIRTTAGRRIVLKPLDEDCLLDGELHPSIRLRLSRVRELPMTAVANLHGVECIDGRAFLIWDYIEGRTLEELTQPQRRDVEREVRLVVEMLHSQGIVHGALHERNIIIDSRGGVHLTHVSPLLHVDFDKDIAALEAIFESTEPLRRGTTQRLPRLSPLNLRAVFGAAVALVAGLLITISILWYASQSP